MWADKVVILLAMVNLKLETMNFLHRKNIGSNVFDTYQHSLEETVQCYFGLNVEEIDLSMADSNLDRQYACREYFVEHS